MAATIIISIVLASLLALAIRRIHRKGTCDCAETGLACASCPKCQANREA